MLPPKGIILHNLIENNYTENDFVIVYNRLWDTMALKGVTQYKLIANGISHSTLTRLKKNQPVNTDTLNKLCTILDCKIEEIVEYKN